MNIQNVQEEESPYFMGYLPFKYLKIFNYINPFYFKKYDSRTYSINYKAQLRLNENIWNQYKTDYFIELPNIKELKQIYNRDGFVPRNIMDKALQDFKKATANTEKQSSVLNTL